MPVAFKHVLRQGPVIATIGSSALTTLRQKVNGPPSTAPQTPTERVTATLPPRNADLIRAYVRHVGGDPSAYKKTVPAHLFPQWGFPLAAKTLADVPYPLMKVLNGGCRLEVHAPLPQGEALQVSARLEDIDDNGRRAVLHQVIETGTKSVPHALTAHLYAIVPVGGPGSKSDGPKNGQKNGAKKRQPARVPHDAEELQRWRLKADAGLDFAKLTGDFNPVHWIPQYAKMFGFKNTILHGFATMARALEGLNRRVFAGDVTAVSTFDVKFTRPLVLPHKVGLYVHGREVYVGDAPGGPAYLVGSYETRER